MNNGEWLDLPEAPIAVGGRAMVFRHPTDREAVVKVSLCPEERGLRGTVRAYKLRRKLREAWHLHEQAFHAFRRHRHDPPVPRIAGLAVTRLGTGLVIERIGGTRTELGPTLEQLVKGKGIGAAHRRAVVDLMTMSMECGVAVPDLQLGNIVWGTARGRTRMFIVDGFDGHTFIRNFGWSRSHDMRRMQRIWRARILAPLRIEAAAPARAVAGIDDKGVALPTNALRE